jgi:hypothetical protein
MIHKGLGSVAFVLMLGACEVQVGSAPPPQPAYAGGPPPAQVAQAQAHPAPPPARPAPPPAHPMPPPPPPQVHAVFTGRIIHPLPVMSAQTGTLDIAAMKARIKPGQKCGPREISAGHWVHIDCNKYTMPRHIMPMNARKTALLMQGKLRLDTAVGGSLPDAVDHRTDGTEGPIKDQGQVGSCTAFSLSSAMDNGIRRQNKSDTVSSIHIWSHYGQPDMGAAGDGNVGKDIALWDQWKYDERLACEIGPFECGPYNPPTPDPSTDPILQNDIKQADAEGNWIVKEYDTIGNDPTSIATMLATGADVWFAMQLGSPFQSPNGDTISDWTPDDVIGGHAILFAGYRHKNGTRQFLVHNSWGTSWGDNGFAYVSEAMVTQSLVGAYKVVVASKNPPPPPPPSPTPPTPTPPGPPHPPPHLLPIVPPGPGPTPPPPSPPPQPTPPPNPNALTDDDCGENELVDSVTGQCAAMCPDDSRPANGKCTGGTGGHH